jgi:hypothetical protein
MSSPQGGWWCLAAGESGALFSGQSGREARRRRPATQCMIHHRKRWEPMRIGVSLGRTWMGHTLGSLLLRGLGESRPTRGGKGIPGTPRPSEERVAHDLPPEGYHHATEFTNSGALPSVPSLPVRGKSAGDGEHSVRTDLDRLFLTPTPRAERSTGDLRNQSPPGPCEAFLVWGTRRGTRSGRAEKADWTIGRVPGGFWRTGGKFSGMSTATNPPSFLDQGSREG